MKKRYDVAAYIWPSYTGDEPRTRIFWPEGDGEWQTVRAAKTNTAKKPEGYVWDREPLWGYVNEADPKVMEMQIECAAGYGVNVFIYDWYWFDRRPFLENCLNDGYLKAKNNDKVKFYIMWANHDATHLWSLPLSDTVGDEVIWRGDVDRAEFERVVHRIIEKYFSHPSYYKIDGKPVFMIYDLEKLVEGLGGVCETNEAFDYFREEAKKAGFAGVYLQVVARGADFKVNTPTGVFDAYRDFGFDGVSEYQMRVMSAEDRDYDFTEINEIAKAQYETMSKREDICYFPHVSVGWDTNPRFISYQPRITHNNTPENVEKAFRQAKEYIDSHDLPAPLVTVNSWNEWTETSYLQPDNLYGYGYLEAVKKVFLDEE